MELSKLSINSIAKEELRRRFFDSRSAKSKTSDESDSSDRKPDGDLETSEEEKPRKAKQAIDQTVVPRLEEETSASEDDGFPLITSVFSLALSSSGTEGEGCGSTDKMCVSSDGVGNTTGTSQSISYMTLLSSNNVPVCNQGTLPFVVKCSPNGVISVCSPPNPTSMSSNFREDNEDSTTITSSLNVSVCSTESSGITRARTDQQMCQDTTTVLLPSSATGSNPNMVTFIDATQQTVIPVEKPRCEMAKYLSTGKDETLKNDNTVCSTQNPISCPQTAVSSITNVQGLQQTKEVQSPQTVNTNLATTSVKTSSSVLPSKLNVADSINERNSTITESNKTKKEPNNGTDPSTLHHTLSDEAATYIPGIKEEYTDQPVPTMQEERIRRLKDLLRQKEAELEKFRFKGKTGSVSVAAQLRANFLQKNPSLCRRSQRLNTNEGTESNDQFSKEASSSKDTGLDTSDKNDLTCKKKITSETESNASDKKISEKADVKISSTSSKQKSTKFKDQDKYKLVNVTILQGHTRTLAVPLDSENVRAVPSRNNAQNRHSLASTANETTTRKRKQQMPRKVGPSRLKRKSNSEENTAGLTSPGQRGASKPAKTVTAVCSDSSKPHFSKDAGTTGPNTRSSPRRREGIQSLITIPLKRKSSSTNEFKTQDGPSASKKVPRKIFSAPKTTKIVSPPAKFISSLKLPTPCEAGQIQTGSLVTSKAGPTLSKPKGTYSIKLATGAITATTDKSTTQPSTTLTSSTTTTIQNNITFNLKDTKQVTTTSKTGKNIAYVLHMNGVGATTNQKGNCPSSLASGLVKRVAESISKEVFALVGNVSEDDTGSKGDFKTSNSPVTSFLPATKIIAQSNLEAIVNQSRRESTVINPTSATNSIKKIPPASCKGPVPMLSSPLVNFQHSKIRNELAKLGLTSTNNVPSQSKVVIPVNIGPVNVQTVNSTTTSQLIQPLPVSCQSSQVVQNIQNDTAIKSRQLTVPFVNSQMTSSVTGLISTVAVPILATTTNSQVKNTPTESLSSASMKPAASTVPNKQISTVVTATNVQADSNNRIGNSLKNLLTTASRIAPAVKREATTMITRPLAPKPKYTLTALTVPVAIASSQPNTKNVHASPTKNNANTNPTPRPLAPKPTTPQYTSHRLLAPKPTPTQYSSPTPISLKPATLQSNTPVPLSSNPTTPQSTSSQHCAAKPTSTQCTSPRPLTPKSTSSQSTATNPTTSEPLNQVINILPKPVMAVPTSSSPAFPENLNNGKILVYDVVQSNLAQGGRNPPLASKDAAKLVVYVSNTGETRNLGIIKDKKIYLNSNQVAAVANQPKAELPVTTSTSDFIPNPEDADFKVLLGLEHVVKLLT